MSPELEYNFMHGYGIDDNVFRYGSDAWCALVREARKFYQAGKLDELDEEDFILLESEEGEIDTYYGEVVTIGVPIWDAAVGHYWIYNRDNGGNLVQLRYTPT